MMSDINENLLKEETSRSNSRINQEINIPITKKIQEIIEEEENIKWQIKKIDMKLVRNTDDIPGIEDKIKHEQLLRELRLYQEKLVHLHSQRMQLHDELNRYLGEKETPMNLHEQSVRSSDLEFSYFRTTERLTLKDKIATEQEALAKAEEARL